MLAAGLILAGDALALGAAAAGRDGEVTGSGGDRYIRSTQGGVSDAASD
jgi:hypothetical protein